MCISGDVTELSPQQWEAVNAGIAMYKRAAPIIKNGQTYWFGGVDGSYRHPVGWQGILRIGNEGNALCVFHRFADVDGEIAEIVLPSDAEYEVEYIYSAQGEVALDGSRLIWKCDEEMCACAVLLKHKGS